MSLNELVIRMQGAWQEPLLALLVLLLASYAAGCGALRLFRARLSITPNRYRIERKMARAQYLLTHTDLSIKEIAFSLGYCNQLYFSQEFHRITGHSPSKARQWERPS